MKSSLKIPVSNAVSYTHLRAHETGPYLPQTLEGLGKTTKAVLGKK